MPVIWFRRDRHPLAQGFQIPQWFREAKFGIWSHWSPQVEPEQGDYCAGENGSVGEFQAGPFTCAQLFHV
jgi:hypothetical protein